MVAEQIEKRGVTSSCVLNAMRTVPRHLFVPRAFRDRSYEDSPLGIEEEQTISQPYIVAYMTSLLDPCEDSVVLEIGTGSGYQTAVLASIVKTVYTIEVRERLLNKARTLLSGFFSTAIHYHCGYGSRGWPGDVAFDGIIVTAACASIPDELIGQLKPGGRLVAPVGVEAQTLHLVTKQDGKIRYKELGGVRFVPFLWPDDDAAAAALDTAP